MPDEDRHDPAPAAGANAAAYAEALADGVRFSDHESSSISNAKSLLSNGYVRPAQVHATTLQSLAVRASSDMPSGLGPQTSNTKNAYRDADRFVNRWGLRWKIPVSWYEHDDAIRVPFLSPRDIFSRMLEKTPELLFGGYDSPHKIRELLGTFWSCLNKPAKATWTSTLHCQF